MSDERNQKLAELFERSTESLSGEAFIDELRVRIRRQSNAKLVNKVLMVGVLLVVGIFCSSMIDEAVLRVEANIVQTLEQGIFGSVLGPFLKIIVPLSLTIAYMWWRRKRRWICRGHMGARLFAESQRTTHLFPLQSQLSDARARLIDIEALKQE